MNVEPRILHVSTPLSWRGGEQQLTYLAEELAKKGIYQHVLCTRGGEQEKRCIKAGVEFTSIKKRFSAIPARALTVKKICREKNINIIHTHDSHAHTAAVISHFFGNKTPVAVSRRVDFPVSRSPFSRLKYNHKAVKKIICVSEMIEKITGEAIKNKEVLTTVHSGIDIKRFHNIQNTKPLYDEYGLSPDIPLIGNVAALAPHKDYPTFIETAKVLINRGVEAHFAIVGDGPLRDETERLIERSGIARHITMTGFRSDVPEVLSNLDVFLITSKTEGLGTSILDAFGCGIPVAATRAGGIPEIVIHEKTGLTAPVQDPEKLADAVQRLLDDPDLRQRLITGAHDHLKNFTKEIMAEKTLKVYREIVGE